MSMEDARLIELSFTEWDKKGIYRNFVSHHTFTVSPKSRLPPAIFHVNAEAREEAKRVYSQYMFEFCTDNKQSPIWFNPRLDILYLGQKCCVSTVIRLSQMMRLKGISVPRIAIDLGRQAHRCCDWDSLVVLTLSTIEFVEAAMLLMLSTESIPQ